MRCPAEPPEVKVMGRAWSTFMQGRNELCERYEGVVPSVRRRFCFCSVGDLSKARERGCLLCRNKQKLSRRTVEPPAASVKASATGCVERGGDIAGCESLLTVRVASVNVDRSGS
jgi:hypothetical protein